MGRARVYRNIERRQHFVGLDPIDAIALASLLWLLFLVNSGALAVNLCATTVVYAALRIAKRGKPDGFTTDLIRYAFCRRVFLSAAEPDRIGRTHFFCPHDPHNERTPS